MNSRALPPRPAVAVLEIDPSGHVRSTNAPAAKLLGRPRGELEGTSLRTLLAEPSEDALEALLELQRGTRPTWLSLRLRPPARRSACLVRVIPPRLAGSDGFLRLEIPEGGRGVRRS